MNGTALTIGMFSDFFSLVRGGAETYAAGLARQLRRLGHDVSVIAARGLFRPPDPIADELPVRHVQSLFELREWSRTLPGKMGSLVYSFQDWFYRTAVREQFPGWDILHAHGVGVAGAAARHRSEGQRVILTLHGRPSPRFRKRLAAVDLLVSYSRDVCGFVESQLELPCRYVAPGVDGERFRPADKAESRRRLGLDGDPLILFAGRLIPVKNIPVLLDGFRLARERLPGARLVVAGDGVLRARLQRMSHRLGIAEFVKFVGEVPQSVLPSFYSAADLTVLPSSYESLGMACLEAVMCRCPVLVSDKVRDILGLFPETPVFPHKSPEEAARRIVECSRNGHGTAENVDGFGLDAMARAYDGLYRELSASKTA